MPCYSNASDLTAELKAFLATFFSSAEGLRVAEAASAIADGAELTVRTIEPGAARTPGFTRDTNA